MNEIQMMWDMIVPLLITGITIGIVFSIIAGPNKTRMEVCNHIWLCLLLLFGG